MGDGDTGNLKRLPLEQFHRDAGARFGSFAGWSMPLTYPLGVMKEHLHARAGAGLFDISHMRLFEATGEGAAAFLARACPLDAAALGIGQSKYTLLLAPDAGILDDLIVTRLANDRFIIVANAGNAETDEAHFREIAAGFDIRFWALDRVFLALQGPSAEDVLAKAGPNLSDMIFMTGRETAEGWFVTRSGYTGEDGFEIALPLADASGFAAKLLGDSRVQWIGLAARDSLRLEAGLCLHGQDIRPETDPVAAGLMWAIGKALREHGEFIGADALRQKIADGSPERRVGLKPDGRQPVRAGAELFDEAGAPAGRVTSGGFGPSVGHPVAMGYVASDHAKPGSRLFAEIRGARIPVDVSPLPFTPHRYRKG